MAATLHAGCVLVGESGVLIRGASGSGKSTLARDLVAEAERCGLFARLVADDRVRVEAAYGRLVARPVPAIAGLIEIRGVGIAAVEHEPAAVVRLVVDCQGEAAPRLPEGNAMQAAIEGVALPRIAHHIPQVTARIVTERLRRAGHWGAAE